MFFSFFSFLKFIVVSLKEGMFNNANVLFKTKFVDGVSTVARFTQSQAGKIPKEAKSRGKEPN
jgi:structural maintenance of chromosome 2